MKQKPYPLWSWKHAQVKETLHELRQVVMNCPCCGMPLRNIDFVQPEWKNYFQCAVGHPNYFSCICPGCHSVIARFSDRTDILSPTSKVNAEQSHNELPKVTDANCNQQPEHL